VRFLFYCGFKGPHNYVPVHLFNSDALSCMLILPQLPGHTDSASDAAFHPKELIIGLCGSNKQVYLGEMDCLV
jgi:hypothetical protein